MLKRLIFSLIIIFIVSFFILGCDNSQSDNNSSSKEVETSSNKPDEKTNSKEKEDYKITFIELGSVNCIPCRAMQPIMKEIEKEYKGIVKVVFYDVWTKQGAEDAEQYNIRVIPTQVFLDENGEEFFRHEGFFAKEEIERLINNKLEY